jgi:hypothetical protein
VVRTQSIKSNVIPKGIKRGLVKKKKNGSIAPTNGFIQFTIRHLASGSSSTFEAAILPSNSLGPVAMPEPIDTGAEVIEVVESRIESIGELYDVWQPFLDKVKTFLEVVQTISEVNLFWCCEDEFCYLTFA